MKYKSAISIGLFVNKLHFYHMSELFRDACAAIIAHTERCFVADPAVAGPRAAYHSPALRLVVGVSGSNRMAAACAPNGALLDIAPGDALILPPGAWFVHRRLRGRFLNIGWRAIGLDCRLRSGAGIEAHSVAAGVVPRATVAPTVRASLACIEQLCHDRASSVALQHALRCALVTVVEALDDGMPLRPYSSGVGLWQRIGELIQERFATDFDRTAAAHELGIHPQHLSRVCSEHGSGFVTMLTEARLHHACRLLRTSELSVADIAQRCGFRSAQYFNRVFRASCGQTPRAWRLVHT